METYFVIIYIAKTKAKIIIYSLLNKLLLDSTSQTLEANGATSVNKCFVFYSTIDEGPFGKALKLLQPSWKRANSSKSVLVSGLSHTHTQPPCANISKGIEGPYTVL